MECQAIGNTVYVLNCQRCIGNSREKIVFQVSKMTAIRTNWLLFLRRFHTCTTWLTLFSYILMANEYFSSKQGRQKQFI